MKTEQELIKAIATENLGDGLFLPEHENELYGQYLARYIPEIKAQLYEDPQFAKRLNKCMPIESVYAISADINKGQLQIIEMPYLKIKEPNPKEKIRYKHFDQLSSNEWLVATVLFNARTRGVFLEAARDSTLITLAVWRLQSKEFDAFCKQTWLESLANGCPAKAISITRLRRFAETAIREEYGIAKAQ